MAKENSTPTSIEDTPKKTGKIKRVEIKNLRGIEGIKFRIRQRAGMVLGAAAIAGAGALATAQGTRTAYRHFTGYNPAEISANAVAEGDNRTEEVDTNDEKEEREGTKKTDTPNRNDKDNNDENGGTETTNSGDNSDEDQGEPTRAPRHRIHLQKTDNEDDIPAAARRPHPRSSDRSGIEHDGGEILKKLDDVKKFMGAEELKGAIEEAKTGVKGVLNKAEDMMNKGAELIKDISDLQKFKNKALHLGDMIAFWGVFLFCIGKYFRYAKVLIDIKKKLLQHHDPAVVQNLENLANTVNSLIESVNASGNTQPADLTAEISRLSEAVKKIQETLNR